MVYYPGSCQLLQFTTLACPSAWCARCPGGVCAGLGRAEADPLSDCRAAATVVAMDRPGYMVLSGAGGDGADGSGHSPPQAAVQAGSIASSGSAPPLYERQGAKRTTGVTGRRVSEATQADAGKSATPKEAHTDKAAKPTAGNRASKKPLTPVKLGFTGIAREKNGRKMCPHMRRSYLCVECGGAGICPHGRRRGRCAECGGASICEHQRIRYACKECGGAGICKHKREKASCRECGGSAICQHNRRRSECKDCKGSGICEHNRERKRCRECVGGSICEHNRVRYVCRDCGGAGICQHGREKKRCKDCRAANTLLSLVTATK